MSKTDKTRTISAKHETLSRRHERGMKYGVTLTRSGRIRSVEKSS